MKQSTDFHFFFNENWKETCLKNNEPLLEMEAQREGLVHAEDYEFN